MLPLVIRVKKPNGQTQTFAFAESPVRIGRSPLNHLKLDEEYISRIEAVVRFDAKEVSYFQVGRTNTTLLQNQPVASDAEVTIDERALLVIGKLELRFTREAVDEAKVIRRSSQPPRGDDASPNLNATTVYASRLQALAAEQPTSAPQQRAPQPAVPVARAIEVSPIVPISPQAGGIATRHMSIGVPSAQAVAPSAPVRGDRSPQTAQPTHGQGLRFHHEQYRNAWRSMLLDIENELTTTAAHDRPAVAERIQREYPQVIRENEFRELLNRLGLKPRKPGDPELEQWLRSLGKGLFPPGVRLDTGMTMERLIALLQMFSQVFVEIQAAQNDVRREMALQGGGSNSMLTSEDPNVILAYLLNPTVDGVQRMAELEQCVTKLALHEAALFGAIKDGAHALLESLSPATLEQEHAQASGAGPSVLSRVFTSKQDSTDAKLWRRYAAMHADLMDGKQYQRRFVGREFARIYLRAMEKLAPDL